MVLKEEIQYFLGAYCAEGYHSLFGQLLPSASATAIYLLKGGGGGGTSAVLRQLEAEATARHIPCEQILSVEDPEIMEGLLFPTLQIGIVDATSPHVLEPQYVGVVDRYVNLGQCYRYEGLQEVREKVVTWSNAYKQGMARLCPCLTATGEISDTLHQIVHTEKLQQRLSKRATGILNREVRKKGVEEKGRVIPRFFTGYTSRGRVTLFHSGVLQCERIYQLWDSYGIAHGFLLPLLTGAVERGYTVVAGLNPLAPQQIEHVLIPELSLGFLTSTPSFPMEEGYFRKIRLETMIDGGLLKENRPRLRMYRKMYQALTEEAVRILEDNQKIHATVEALYQPYVDFEKVSQMTAQLGKEIFGDVSLPSVE